MAVLAVLALATVVVLVSALGVQPRDLQSPARLVAGALLWLGGVLVVGWVFFRLWSRTERPILWPLLALVPALVSILFGFLLLMSSWTGLPTPHVELDADELRRWDQPAPQPPRSEE